ncbi:hypothetical protein HMPREF0973_02130 [Prevotella veroralis F0319]|uniref:Uncharacterized protein n=1 Tax=Prevotella veroralis F0319 TaxID=649761 RepID=C9MR94_9BACT|nr:hypothetical protein HMPREF0973_02130 [Prevotella veroralis F0319]
MPYESYFRDEHRIRAINTSKKLFANKSKIVCEDFRVSLIID